MAKQPDWKSRTALNITEFTLFDIFGSACSGVEILSKCAGSLRTVLSHMYANCGQCRL